MAIDPYSLCPGGTGKKVKFCCPDLLSELEQIQKMLAGDQRQACLEYIEQLEAKHPNRVCLLTTKALLQGQLGESEAAQQTVGKVLEAQPENPVALAEQALFLANSQGGRAAVEPLQRAIAASESQIDYKVFEIIGVLAQALIAEGHLPAALAHAGLQMRINPKYEPALQLIVELASSLAVPLLFKDIPLPFDKEPVETAWQDEFAAALDKAQRSRWLEAAEAFGRLAEHAGNAPAIWRNLGMLRAYLADDEGAMQALRHYSTLDVPLDDAVEAEAIAQLLDPIVGEQVDLVFLEYPIKDFDQFLLRLTSDRGADQLSNEEISWDEPDQPPPRASFWLLDRPMPASGIDLAFEDVPESLAQLFVFGRETDREARLEMSVYRDQLDAAKTLLAKLGGECLGAPGAEEVISATPRVARALSWNWRMPQTTPYEHVRKLTARRQRQAMLEVWPQTPNPAIDEKTPQAAAADPALKVKLLAAILILETSASTEIIDFNELRTRLGLPAAAPIDPSAGNVRNLPLVRYNRLLVEKLSDDDLLAVYSRALMARARRALRKIAAEAASRPSLEGKVDKAQVYGTLASLSEEVDQAVKYIHQARDAAEAAGRSSAPWDFEELQLQLVRGDGREIERLLVHLQTDHGKEPGVMQRLTQLLYQMGVIDERGRPIGRPAEESAGLIVPGGSSEAAGKLWTPGAETGESKKSGLWVPGMD